MTDPRTDLAERMARAARDLQDQDDPQGTLDRAVQLALDNVRGADAAGLTLVHRRRRLESPAWTSDVVDRADRLQEELGEGPCLDAIFEEQVVHAPDLLDEDRWSRWAPRVAEELDVRSMLCLRLFTHEDTVGALNLYAAEPRAFDAASRDDGLAIAAHVAVAVAAAKKIDQLSTAVQSRTVIGQAIGITMERYDLDADRAFDVLSRISPQTNRRLVDVATELVDTRRLPQPGQQPA